MLPQGDRMTNSQSRILRCSQAYNLLKPPGITNILFFFPLDHHSSHLHKEKLQKVPEYSAHVFRVSY